MHRTLLSLLRFAEINVFLFYFFILYAEVDILWINKGRQPADFLYISLKGGATKLWMRYNRVVIECLAVNAKVAIVLGSIPASSDTVESEGRQMKQC